MGIIVQKYGGTSVGSIERIRNVARRVIARKADGHRVVVVVSAMAGRTDQLVALADEVTDRPAQREYDVLLSSGEQVSVALLAMTLIDMGHPARSFLAHQVQIRTDAAHTKARIRHIEAPRLMKALDEGEIAVLAGFQGMDDDGDITTLGRGGSDTSAVAVAAAINADLCEICTDVDGIYTTDPNICADARKIDRISYEEMLELASLGAKVLQPRSVEFAMKYEVPLVVRSSFSDAPGSWVTKEVPQMESVVVNGIAYDKKEAKLTLMGVPDIPGIAATVFGALAEENVVVDMIIQNVSEKGRTDVTFTVPKSDATRAQEVIADISARIGAEGTSLDDHIAKVSVVGVGMRSHSGVASTAFKTLADAGINIQMISTSEIKISMVIDGRYLELAVRELHDAFGLAEAQIREEDSFAPPS